MSLESNPMLVMEFLEVIKESAVECKDKSCTSCVCLDDIKLDSLLYVINSAEEIIRKLNDHERPQGEWIYNRPNSQTGANIFRCSICNHETQSFTCGIKNPVFDNYCGNCGAEMRGGRE